MLPAGQTTDDHITQVKTLLSEGDILVEGGNSFYKDDLRHAAELKPYGIHYVDAGVSGGIWGLKIGYCLMIGGEKRMFHYLEPIFKALAPKDGYLYCGSTGAGHFVKMTHNGIEYGMMSAYGEGFELMKASPYGKGPGFRQGRPSLEPGERRALLAPRAGRVRPCRKTEIFRRSKDTWKIPGKAAGPCSRPSNWPSPPRSSPLPFSSASAPARRTPSRIRFWRLCAMNSAATPSSRPGEKGRNNSFPPEWKK